MAGIAPMTTTPCPVCGGGTFGFQPILPPRLVADWALSPAEAAYIDRQQGEYCTGCYANLRSMVLADAILALWGAGPTLRAACDHPGPNPPRVLELNPAGTLHADLRRLPGHCLGEHPAIDMHALPWADGSFDLVVHSDTLEHVAFPERALAECLRVTRAGGAVVYTVPIVVGRLTRSRAGLPPSHHGPAGDTRDDYLVHTEFGADAWLWPMRAGAREVRLFTRAHPAAHAIAAFPHRPVFPDRPAI